MQYLRYTCAKKLLIAYLKSNLTGCPIFFFLFLVTLYLGDSPSLRAQRSFPEEVN